MMDCGSAAFRDNGPNRFENENENEKENDYPADRTPVPVTPRHHTGADASGCETVPLYGTAHRR